MSDLSSSVGGPLSGLARIDAASRIDRARQAGRAPADSGTAQLNRAEDRVEVSQAAVLLKKLSDLPEVRTDLVEGIKAQIRAGNYDTPERFDAALDGMINEEILGE